MDLFRPQLEVLNLIFLIGFFIQIQNKTLHSTDNLKYNCIRADLKLARYYFTSNLRR